MLSQYGDTWLTGSIYGSRLRGGARNIRVNDRQVVQVAEFIRAAQVSVYGRGCIETSVAFESAWTFDTEAEAGATCMAFRGTVPNNADAQFTFGYGLAARVLQLDDAALEQCAPVKFDGRTVAMAFLIHGGRLYETTLPATTGLRVWNPDTSTYCVLQARGTGLALTLQVSAPSGAATGRAGGVLVFNPDSGANCLLVARGAGPIYALEISADGTGALPNVPQLWNPDIETYDSLIARNAASPFTLHPYANT